MLEFQKHVMANIEWVSTDDPKYEVRSREAFPCENKHHRTRQNQWHISTKMHGHLYLHCHRCSCTFSVHRFPDIVFP